VIARGAAPGQAVASGIPISSRFEKPVDPRQVRQTLGLRDDQPVLLVLSGGFGMGPVGAILAALDKVPLAFQTVVVTGKNQELRRELAAQDHKHPTHVLGFVSNMYELMAASELILSKPGGLTTSEALALGKPMLIIDPIPGQEAANSDFLLQHGAAQKVNRTDDLPFRVEQLLASGKLAELGKNAAALGKPQAARQICVEVARRVNTASAAG
jgi:processive 1,2-diacylglycerol beta-glucosyltransferase